MFKQQIKPQKYIELQDRALHRVGVIWIGRWAGERKERITEGDVVAAVVHALAE